MTPALYLAGVVRDIMPQTFAGDGLDRLESRDVTEHMTTGLKRFG